MSAGGASLPYHPDILAPHAVEAGAPPLWWAECGSVSVTKLSKLAVAYPSTSFTVAKWARSDLRGYAGSLRRDLPAGAAHRFEVISFPADSAERFISDDGEISVGFADLLDQVPLLQGQ